MPPSPQTRKRIAGLDVIRPDIALRAAFIIAAALWIYAPVLHGGFVWDDDWYIAGNPQVADPAGLPKIWLQPGGWVDYYPIESTVLWFEWWLWGDDTFGYHVVTLLMHIVAALLVWRLFWRMGLRLAWLGGLLFAIHPAQVESVAWITELKNTLSLPPFLLAMIAWIDFESGWRTGDYLRALGFYLLAMFCKISMALFPFVILLYAWWKRGRIGWDDLKAAVPFFAISLVLGVIEIWSGVEYMRIAGGTSDEMVIGWPMKLVQGGVTLAYYLGRCFWPGGMAPVYPHWNMAALAPLAFAVWLGVGGFVAWAWMRRAGWGRHALLGLGFFLVMIVMFLGFDTTTYMSFTWVMDHFLYIPIIGIIGLVIAGAEYLEKGLSRNARTLGIGVVTALVILFAVISRDYAAMFVDNETLWTYAISRNPASAMAHNNLGTALDADGEMQDAFAQFQEAVRLDPQFGEAQYNLGAGLLERGQDGDAITHLQAALAVHPHDVRALNDLGVALAHEGRITEAREKLEQAVHLDPAYAEARTNLARLEMQTPQQGATR